MTDKYKILLSISFTLALFYALPWLALAERPRIIESLQQASLVKARVCFLFSSVALTSILFFHYNFFWKHTLLSRKTEKARQRLHWLLQILLVILTSLVLTILVNRLFSTERRPGYFIFYVFRNTVIAVLVTLVTYVVELIERSRQDKIKILTLQHQQSESELSALKAQIDPHFLFNSLNSLTGLIRENSTEALAFVNHLSQTFRYILDNKENKVVTVQEELRFLDSYLFMMKKRFASGLEVTFRLEEDHLRKPIPQFALQMLLENAIKHNKVSKRSPLTVDIFSEGQTLVVRNNVQPKQGVSGYGIGLANLSKRYQLLQDVDITIEATDASFQVRLPFL